MKPRFILTKKQRFLTPHACPYSGLRFTVVEGRCEILCLTQRVSTRVALCAGTILYFGTPRGKGSKGRTQTCVHVTCSLAVAAHVVAATRRLWCKGFVLLAAQLLGIVEEEGCTPLSFAAFCVCECAVVQEACATIWTLLLKECTAHLIGHGLSLFQHYVIFPYRLHVDIEGHIQTALWLLFQQVEAEGY